MDYHELASELLRALRGQRSQTAFSRRLGYRSNVAYAWESGRRYPTAAETMRVLALTGHDLGDIWQRFYSTPPAWLGGVDLQTARGVAWLLSDMRGRVPISELAARSGFSRFAISRWLNAQTEPRLPDFLRLFDSFSLRLLDWLALLVDIAQLPSAHEAWRQLEAQRQMALELPWTQAILRVFELEAYAKLPRHDDDWIASHLGLAADEVRSCLAVLETAGQIHWDGRHWQLASVIAVDTRPTPEDGRRMKAFWAEQGLRALEQGSSGQFSYNVFGVSEADLKRIQKLHLAYYRQIRQIISDSTPTERIAVVNVQLFALDAGALGRPRD